MPQRKVWHVRWDAEERVWYVKRSGRNRHREKPTKEEAVEVAKDVAKNNEPSMVIIHKQDGTTNASHEYG
jgi:hypothetical protein